MDTPKAGLICPQCGSEDVEELNGICVCFSCRARFPAPKAPTPFHPMRLFISYGHPEATICQRIMAALQERGHQVWFDKTSMVHGEDWREQIADGIRRSDGVVSCLSVHSVRDPGVSLDELSIAIGVRGGNIKTILLEPERLVHPPASVCHIQWLDMSQWRAYMDRGEAAFKPWFDSRMQELFQVLESEESLQFTGQITAIRERLHVNYDTSKQQELLRKGVVGREWLTEQVEAWLDDADGPRLCVLYGDPGVGKSAFAAKYIHYNPRVAAGLFCEYDRPLYNDAATVIMTLAYLLACRLPDYRLALVDILDREKRLGELGAAELFDRLLATPLTSLVIGGGRQTLCVVIDGLDECAQGERNALAEVLAQYAPRLPVWLRILATARDVSSVTGPLEGACSIQLRGGQQQNRQDVKAYLAGQLQDRYGSEPGWDAALDALAEKSGGIFLYASLAADAIRQGRASLQDAGAFPAGLSGMFHRWFGWFFPDQEEYEKRFRLPLGLILAAPAPLPVQELRRICKWDENDLDSFLRRMKVLLHSGTDEFGEQTAVFSHQYLNEWLDTPAAERFRTSRSAALERMAEAFCRLFGLHRQDITHYEALYMLPLQELAGRTGSYDALAADRDLFRALIRAGDQCETRERLDAALRCFAQARSMAERIARQPDGEDSEQLLCISYEKEAGILDQFGHLSQALERMDKCLACAERRAALSDAPEIILDLSYYYGQAGHLLNRMGRPDLALAYYEKVRGPLEKLVRRTGKAEHRSSLRILYELLAAALNTLGRPDQALAYYEQDIAISEQLLREQPSALHRRVLAMAYCKAADILVESGKLGQALAFDEKALHIAEQQAELTDDASDKRALYILCSETARVLRQMGRLDEALALYERAKVLTEQRVRERDTPEIRRDLCVIYARVALALEEKGRPDQALELLKECVSISESLIRQTDDPSPWEDLAIYSDDAIRLLQTTGRLDEALAMAQHEQRLAAGEKQEQLPDIPARTRLLVSGCLHAGRVLQKMKQPDQALACYEKALAPAQRLAQEQGTPGDWRTLCLCRSGMANILAANGRLDQALELYQQALTVRQSLAQKLNSAYDQRDLCALCIDELGPALEKAGRLDQALAIYEKALAIGERMLQQGAATFQRVVPAACTKCADILCKQGRLKQALACCEKALPCREKLVQARGTPRDRAEMNDLLCRTAELLDRLEQPDRAIALYEQALDSARQLVMQHESEAAYRQLADIYRTLGELIGQCKGTAALLSWTLKTSKRMASMGTERVRTWKKYMK